MQTRRITEIENEIYSSLENRVGSNNIGKMLSDPINKDVINAFIKFKSVPSMFIDCGMVVTKKK